VLHTGSHVGWAGEGVEKRKANTPLARTGVSGAGASTRVGEEECKGSVLLTATAHTTPRIGTEPAFMHAKLAALIIAAVIVGLDSDSALRDWTTSWMRVRGFWVRMREVERAVRRLVESAFASVPGMEESGRTVTSTVALEGCSEARRTSRGPERDARALVDPVGGLVGWNRRAGCQTECERGRTVNPVQCFEGDLHAVTIT
jgi:hypothetical protein